MIIFIIFKVLPAVLALGFALYLAYMQANPERYEAILAAQKKGTPMYSLYSKMYTPQFLTAWVFIMFSFLIDVPFGVYSAMHVPSGLILFSFFIANMTLSIAGLYLLVRLFRKK